MTAKLEQATRHPLSTSPLRLPLPTPDGTTLNLPFRDLQHLRWDSGIS